MSRCSAGQKVPDDAVANRDMAARQARNESRCTTLRGGFFNVWGIHFEPSKGKPVGEPFRVTAFERPGVMVPRNIPDVELSLNQNKLVLTMEELFGSIWVLDNVGQ